MFAILTYKLVLRRLGQHFTSTKIIYHDYISIIFLRDPGNSFIIPRNYYFNVIQRKFLNVICFPEPFDKALSKAV